MSDQFLQILVYLLLGGTIVFYVILDGFDLGVGSLQIFAGSDHDRRIFLNSIGPFWDGNEVWLIAIVGILLVGFPPVYAAILSGFYTLIMIMLFGIILRAVAIEFRSKEESKIWRYTWDFVFWFSSIIITFSAGVLLGNLLIGVPVDYNGDIYINFSEIFRGYPIFIGMLAISLFAMHGNLFLLIKTEAELQEKLHQFAFYTISLFYFFFIASTIWTWGMLGNITMIYLQYKIFFLIPLVLIILMAFIPVLVHKKRYGYAFFVSMSTITLLFLLPLIGTFPNMVPSNLDYDSNTLTVFNASSERLTLIITLIVAATGIPLVLTYGYILYRIFHGKTQVTDHSY